MKEFPRDSAEWVASLPYYGEVRTDADGKLTRVSTRMFADSRSHFRLDIEAGFAPCKETSNDDIFFNFMMSSQVAAFADILGEYTRMLYGRDRTVALLKILARCYWRRTELGFGTRSWLHSVCQEALS